ncbi:hypothetical protein PRN20_09585 [Devosia sp. ZB163]|uniref:hypothetical protein n=1 Tax=Devosia sp. ZB163 TaxID=3025938 RepID=UPI0023602C28|nr:hypothetical protein [Devosia sp. ZB163]MDC9823987.1 hypothetical protein [Devosia sp. ZB163]
MIESLSPRLHSVLNRDLLLDLEDRERAEALKAFEMVRDGSGLQGKRARELEGQARFRMMEKGFEEVCALHGGQLLDGGVLPDTDLKVFQPFMRFEGDGGGVILGLAAMPDRHLLPGKNKSRLAGVKLNYHLAPRLDFDAGGPKIGDFFALLLVSRDKSRSGVLEEIAIGVVNSEYTAFLFYEPLDQFLRGAGDATAPETSPLSPTPADVAGVTLKKKVIPFVPPEAAQQDEGEEDKK